MNTKCELIAVGLALCSVIFALVIAISERDVSRIQPGPLVWYTSALTNGLQEGTVSEVMIPIRISTICILKIFKYNLGEEGQRIYLVHSDFLR